VRSDLTVDSAAFPDCFKWGLAPDTMLGSMPGGGAIGQPSVFARGNMQAVFTKIGICAFIVELRKLFRKGARVKRLTMIIAATATRAREIASTVCENLL